jgi:hypothetical protein
VLSIDWRVLNLLNQESFQDMSAVKLIRVWTTFASLCHSLRRGVRCGARRAARCVSGLRRDVVATIAAGPATAAPAERAAACMTRATAGALPGSPPGGARAVHSARAPHGVGLRRGFCGMVHRRLPLSPVLLSRGESGKCEGIVAGDS